jgi:hypothetical protein
MQVADWSQSRRAESHALRLLGPVVAIAKGDLAVRKGFQQTVGDGDAKGITGQIIEVNGKCVSRLLLVEKA